MNTPLRGSSSASWPASPDDALAEATSSPEDVIAFVAQMDARRAREVALWGDLGAAMRLKQTLVRRMGPAAAFEALRGTLGVPGTDKLRERRTASLRDAVAAGHGYRELWRGGEAFRHTPPPIEGPNDSAAITGTDRVLYVGCVEDAFVRGRSSLILHGDLVLVDVETEERGQLRDHLEHDPGVLHAKADRVWSMEPRTVETEIDEGLLLAGAGSDDAWQWLTEYLPRLALTWLSDLDEMPVLIDARIPVRHVEALRLLVPGARLVALPHQAPVRVRRLWIASAPSRACIFPLEITPAAWAARSGHAWRRAALHRVLKARLVPLLEGSGGAERIYLARTPDRRKALLDDEAIEAVARRHGFIVVHAEDHSFAELAAIAHHARWLIAPEGPHVGWAFFAQPGCELLMLSSPITYPLTDRSAVLAALGVGVRILTGPVSGERPDWPFWADYRVEAAAFDDLLASWSA